MFTATLSACPKMHCSYDSVTDRITDGRTDATPRSHSLDVTWWLLSHKHRMTSPSKLDDQSQLAVFTTWPFHFTNSK